MPAYNIVTITRAPDPTTKIITLDFVNDGIEDGEGGCRNVELVVVGAELKGIEFLMSGDPAVYSETWPGVLMMLRANLFADVVTVRNLDAGVADVSKIAVTGSVFADGYLTRAGHIGAWAYCAELGHYCTALNLWLAV